MISNTPRLLALMCCASVFVISANDALEHDAVRAAKDSTIKQRLDSIEETIADLAATVTLHSNRIDARLRDLEDKLDLILVMLADQQADDSYEEFTLF